MYQPNAGQQRKADLDLEEVEAYLGTEVLTCEQAWPPHYQDAVHRLELTLAKFLDPEQLDEVEDAIAGFAGAVDGVQLRIGFHLGRTWGAYGELTERDACLAVEAAGGNPGRALAEAVERELAQVVQ